MEEILQGQYNLHNAFIDCNSAYSDFAVFAHELAHYSLTKNTLFGILHFLIEQINEPVFSEKQNLSKIISIMTDASERTQEVYAMYYQLLHVSSQYGRFFKSYYFNFKQHLYYSMYQFSDFEWMFGDCGLNNNTQLMDRICAIAMNVDITKCLEIVALSTQENLFHAISKNRSIYMPDFRLEKMTSLIHNNGPASVSKMEDYEIANESGIEYNDFSTSTVLTMLKKLKLWLDNMGISSSLVQRNINNIEDNHIELKYNQIKDEDFVDKMKQTILPECLNYKYRQIELKSFPCKAIAGAEIMTLFDSFPLCLCELTDIRCSYNYILQADIKNVSQFIANYAFPVQFYFDDYATVPNNWPDLIDRPIFFILKNPYYEYKNLISNYMHPQKYAFILQMNDGVFFLFSFGKENNKFNTCQSMININFVLSDFEKEFFTYPDISFLTNYDEWQNYLRIISYFSGKNFLDMTKEDFIKRLIIPPHKP